MTTHTIEIEGLPEGWEAKPIKLPNMLMGSGGELYADVVITLQKTKPRRIVLEETDNLMQENAPQSINTSLCHIVIYHTKQLREIKEE